MGVRPTCCRLHLLQQRNKLLPHCPESSPPATSFAPLGTSRPNGDCTPDLGCEPPTDPRHLGKEG